jgi:hypothetical protein
MYDDMGRLKKKYRSKAAPGMPSLTFCLYFTKHEVPNNTKLKNTKCRNGPPHQYHSTSMSTYTMRVSAGSTKMPRRGLSVP